MLAECLLAKIKPGGLRLKVNNNVVSGSCNLIDAGTSFTCYFQHIQAIKYFCESGVDTYHYIYDPQSLAAYKAKDSNRPAVSCNISPWKVGPAVIEDSKVKSVHTYDFTKLAESLKLKLLVYLFVFKHWGKKEHDDIQFNFDFGDQEAMYEKILDIWRQLKVEKIVDSNMVAPVKKVDVQVDTERQSRRPGGVVTVFDYEMEERYPNDIKLKIDED